MAEFDPVGPNLKLLRAFRAVARACSFTRAAAELRRSQATISMQVRELERLLDVKLLDRTTRQVSLTAAGQQLAEALDDGLSRIDAGIAGARALGAARQGRVTFACVPSLSTVRLPAILAQYRAADPHIRIDVEELTSSEIAAAVVQERIDFGVGPCAEPTPPDITFAAAITDPLVVILPATDKASGADEVSFAGLAALPLITLSGSVLLQRTLEEVAETAGVTLNTHTEVRHVHTAIAMARAGVGAAVVPRLALPDVIEEDVRVQPIVEPAVARRVGLILRAGKPLSPSASRLANHIRASLVKALAD